MPRYTVDVSMWLHVDADSFDDAFDIVHARLGSALDDFEIVNVEENQYA